MIFWPLHVKELVNQEMRVDHITVPVSSLIILVNSRKQFNNMKNSYRYVEQSVMFMVKPLHTTVLVLTT